MCEHQRSGLTHLSIDNRSKAFLLLTQKSRGVANRKEMKIFGEQRNCLLDIFKPYQRPKLSDPARERVRLQPERDGRVRCSAWLN